MKQRSRTCPKCNGSGRLLAGNAAELRKARIAAGLTMTAMAERIGVSLGYLSQIETGERASISQRILAAYGAL
ncbi:helix-turn-helix transcriptional regulator [Staphylococcus aureus]|uniref:helix-turn-helix domain-containing protein n=1 Tax=Staphylococcus aureus TaxID=1280 RepID=UPI0039BDDE54